MKEYWVYILRCSDGTYYTGITNDLDRRYIQHREGIDPSSYTACRRPLVLVYAACFDDVLQAISWEKTVKDWSRKKKEALIRGDYEDLPALSACRNETHHVLSRLRSK